MKKTANQNTAINEAQERYDAENRKQLDLRDQLEEVDADIMLDISTGNTDKDVAELLGDATVGDMPSHTELQRKAEALRKAIKIQSQRIIDAKRNVGELTYQAREVEHTGLVERIADVAEALHDALTAEAEFCREIQVAGVVAPRQIRMAGSCEWLRKVRHTKRDLFRRDQAERGFNIM